MANLSDDEKQKILEARNKLQQTVPQKKAEEQKRCGKLTSAAGIMLIVLFSFYIVFELFSIMSNFTNSVMTGIVAWLFHGLFDSPEVIAVISGILNFALLVTIMTFAIVITIQSKKSLTEFANSKTSRIVGMCFFIIWLMVPIAMIISKIGIAFAVIGIILVLLSCVFIILDFKKANNELKITNSQSSNYNATLAQNDVVNDIEQQLLRIKKLKDNGLVTDEEFEALKSKIIKK